MTLASDSAAGQRAPVLVLNIVVADASGKRRVVPLELTKSDLDGVLAKFAAIQEVGRRALTVLVHLQ